MKETDIQVVEGDFTNIHYPKYYSIVSQQWNDGAYDKQVYKNRSVKIMYLLYKGVCVGGCTITSYKVNILKDQVHLDAGRKLEKQGFNNLTHLVVDDTMRGNGIGSQFMKLLISDSNTPFWLTARPARHNFYSSLGLLEYTPPIRNEIHSIFINKHSQ